VTELRVGIVGAGLIGGVHARAYGATPGVHVVAVTDPVPGKAHRLADDIGAAVVDDLDAMLHRDLDILSICTPTPTHAPLSLQGLEAGLHVLCEKPIARTLADARRLVATAERSPGLLMIGHVTRFEDDHRAAKRLVDEGHLGEIRMISHSVTGSLPGWSQSGWLSDPALSGGPLLDLAVHAFDYLAWVTGSSVVRLHAVGADTAAGAATYAVVHLRYASGAIAQVETSWAHPVSHGFQVAVELIGTEGRLAWDYDQLAGGFLHRADGDTVRFDPIGEQGFATEIGAFVEAVRAGGPSPVSGYEAMVALRTSLAALTSLETGATLDLTSWEPI
jgi:myo-inositol 2-dehydrogenase / D-chiro-inositol 1-dehydrogenase